MLTTLSFEHFFNTRFFINLNHCESILFKQDHIKWRVINWLHLINERVLKIVLRS